MSGTEERRVEEADQAMSTTADELAERGDALDERIDETKQHVARVKADDSVPTAAGDWEDTEPDDAKGDDPAGFDDPENLDEDELEDDDGYGGDDDE